MIAPIIILLIEDNPGDIELVRVGFHEARIANRLDVISDGQEAIEFFCNANTMPDLVLLDINLPKVKGIEILKQIRSMDVSKNIPVIMLTSSDAEADVIGSYAGHANSFITKPVDVDKFLDVVTSIEEFWLSVVKLPQRQSVQQNPEYSQADITP
ncbi:hypothetical protein MNBD_GAMMA13-835 [hydrothermal vent metagenome]|uniref:Response regulatory domain-containing protein n=1 Tax=hydrothermal vent metagenome TaxID=652676 RepID=A0A3B0Z2T2_9ZZZZ